MMNKVSRERAILESLSLNEAKFNLKRDTKYVGMYDGEVVIEFKSQREVDSYLDKASRNPLGVIPEIKKVINGAIVG